MIVAQIKKKSEWNSIIWEGIETGVCCSFWLQRWLECCTFFHLKQLFLVDLLFVYGLAQIP
jgi:hypothetical protein